MTNDPFKITGPAVVSFSGGRTSAYMLWRILQAHGGKLPDDALVLRFWRTQPFQLRLDRDGDGGNCGSMCFMMSAEQIGPMCRKDQARAARWIAREQRHGTKTMAPGRSYASVRDVALNQGVLAWDDASPCDQACGV